MSDATPSAAGSRLTPRRRSTIARVTLYLGAVAVMATGVDHVQQYYVVSESSGLFGFVEHGYRTPIALAIVAEAAAVVLLGIFLAATARTTTAMNSNST